jgi:hypothetical protein
MQCMQICEEKTEYGTEATASDTTPRCAELQVGRGRGRGRRRGRGRGRGRVSQS